MFVFSLSHFTLSCLSFTLCYLTLSYLHLSLKTLISPPYRTAIPTSILNFQLQSSLNFDVLQLYLFSTFVCSFGNFLFSFPNLNFSFPNCICVRNLLFVFRKTFPIFSVSSLILFKTLIISFLNFNFSSRNFNCFLLLTLL